MLTTMLNKKALFPITIATILAAFILPIIFTGYSAARHAEAEFAAQDYASAAESFGQAARLLIWRDDLWERAGIAAALDKNPIEAIDYFQHTSTLTKEGWIWLGSSHLYLGDLDLAVTTFEQGVQLYDSPDLYSLLAFGYRQQKNWEAERNALENQLRLDGGDVYARYRLGLLLTVLAPEQALTNLMLASSLDPGTDPAVQTLRAALNLSSTQPDASQQMVTIGRALGLVQEWDLSIAAFEKAITLNAENAEAWAWLGEAKQQTGDALPKEHRDDVSESKGQGGLTELDRAVSLDHTSVVVRALRGLYWNRQGKYSQMLAEYLLAAEYEPTNPAWQAEIGNAHIKRGDLVAALKAYQRATELAPDESTYWRLLAVFCAENGVHLEDVGLPAAQKAVQLAPDDPLALDALGWTYLSSGRYANAEKLLLDVVKRFPDHLSAHMHLAMTYLAQGNRAAAQDKLLYVQSADPNGTYGEMATQLLKRYFP